MAALLPHHVKPIIFVRAAEPVCPTAAILPPLVSTTTTVPTGVTTTIATTVTTVVFHNKTSVLMVVTRRERLLTVAVPEIACLENPGVERLPYVTSVQPRPAPTVATVSLPVLMVAMPKTPPPPTATAHTVAFPVNISAGAEPLVITPHDATVTTAPRPVVRTATPTVPTVLIFVTREPVLKTVTTVVRSARTTATSATTANVIIVATEMFPRQLAKTALTPAPEVVSVPVSMEVRREAVIVTTQALRFTLLMALISVKVAPTRNVAIATTVLSPTLIVPTMPTFVRATEPVPVNKVVPLGPVTVWPPTTLRA